MENPFVKLVREGENFEDGNAAGSSKEKRIRELKNWKAQVEMGMEMESHSGDAKKLEEIDELIRQAEQEK